MATTKEPDVPNGRFWEARISDPTAPVVCIECSSFYDARAFARMVAGGREVAVMPVGPLVVNRWQVKWAGAGGSQTNPKHLVARRARKGEKFRPVREIDFA